MQEFRSGVRRPSPIFLLLFLMFTVGMLYGVLLIRSDSDLLDTLSVFAGQYALAQREQSILQSFWNVFRSTFLFVLIPYLLGYSAIGQPAALLVPLFKGLGLGAFLGSLYRSYGMGGVGYSALLVIPYTLAALLAVFIACRESIRLSSLFTAGILSDSRFLKKRRPQAVMVTGEMIRLYNLKFLILCGMVLAAAVIYAICVLLFARFFSFIV